MFIVLMGLIFVLVGIVNLVDAGGLRTLLAGIIARNFITKEKLQFVEKELKSITYGMFAPFFFINVGYQVNPQYFKIELLPVLIISILLVSFGKFLPIASIFKKTLSNKEILVVATGTMVNFSTGLIVIQLMFNNKLIQDNLFSLLVSADIFFAVGVPLIFSLILRKIKTNEL